MNVELDRIIDKVKKCIALSKSDNPHEAAAALRQAQALMRKHGIDEAGIVASEVSAADVEHKSGNTARPPAWETMLMMLVGTAFGCKGMFVPAPKVNGRRGAGSYRYVGVSALNKQDSFAMSDLRLGQFYGIELDDFAHEVAILALWLAEHQMNIAFHARFGKFPPTLPLKPSGNIHAGNATAMDWNDICSKSPGDEIYLLGNPPYFGSKKQNKDQKADIASVFKHTRTYKNLDYIACWFMKAARYIRGHNVRAGFVTTNSLVQGDQVGLLWPSIFDQKVAINYAYKPFKWGNNAKNKAGVTCVIIGLANEDVKDRWIYHDTAREQVKNISPYLTNTGNVIVFKRNQVLSGLPEMLVGSR